jgi:hypothetical protein
MAKPVWPTIEETLMMRPDFCDEVRHYRARGEKDSAQVDVEDAVELLLGQVLDGRGVRAHAGVIDEDVDAPELLERLVDEVLGRVCLAHVVLDAEVAVAELLGALLGLFFKNVRQHDAGPLIGHRLGDAEPDATRSPGDDYDTILEIPHSAPPIACVARLLQSGRWPRCSSERSCPGRTVP